MTNFAEGEGMPLGLGMALAQDADAMERFASMDAASRRAVISKAKTLRSKEEIRALVHSIL